MYESGGDPHLWIAKNLLNIETPTKEDREISKVVTFATIYGSEGAAVQRKLKISQSRAEELIHKYRTILPEVENLRMSKHSEADKTNKTSTYFGRERYLEQMLVSYTRDAGRRQSFNTAIQATCADCQKISPC